MYRPAFGIHTKNIDCPWSCFAVRIDVQAAGGSNSSATDVLQKHHDKDARSIANRLPDLGTILEVKKRLEHGYSEAEMVRYKNAMSHGYL